jgi:hypothetical protein
VFLDGSQLNVAITEDGDLWLLSFTFMHSTHNVVISLATSEVEDAFLSDDWIIVLIVAVIAVASVGFIVWRKKEKS